MTTIIFIHGTAVTPSMYEGTFKIIQKQLEKRSDINLVKCFWGGLGAKLNAGGASIPESKVTQKLTDEDEKISLWEHLYIDPLFKLKSYSLLPKLSSTTEAKSKSVTELNKILRGLQLDSVEPKLQNKLIEAGIAQVFNQAIKTVIRSNAYKRAIDNAPELSDKYYDAIAKAIVAQAMFDCSKKESIRRNT